MVEELGHVGVGPPGLKTNLPLDAVILHLQILNPVNPKSQKRNDKKDQSKLVRPRGAVQATNEPYNYASYAPKNEIQHQKELGKCL